MEHDIQEMEAWIEQYQASQRADVQRLRGDLERLESRRADLTARVSADNADHESQRALEKADEEIEDIKLQTMVIQREVRSTLMAKRQEMAELLNGGIEALRNEVTALRDEKERIRSDEIPALERRLEELRERRKSIEGDIRRKSEEINRLSRHTIESVDLEFD